MLKRSPVGALFVWYTIDMNKVLAFASLIIAILSFLALLYFMLHPVIDPCGDSGDIGNNGLAVCRTTETANWTGIVSSLIALVAGLALAIYSLALRKKKEK